MFSDSVSRLLYRARKPLCDRTFGTSSAFRQGPQYQPPTPPEQSNPNAHRAFYKEFGRPMAKVFLGAMFTYQVLYWSWLKLESIEKKQNQDNEISTLEAQLHSLTKDQKASK